MLFEAFLSGFSELFFDFGSVLDEVSKELPAHKIPHTQVANNTEKQNLADRILRLLFLMHL